MNRIQLLVFNSTKPIVYSCTTLSPLGNEAMHDFRFSPNTEIPSSDTKAEKCAMRSWRISFGKSWRCNSVMRITWSFNFSRCAFSKRFSSLSRPFSCLLSCAKTAPKNDWSVCFAKSFNATNCLRSRSRCGLKSMSISLIWRTRLLIKEAWISYSQTPVFETLNGFEL